MIGRHNPCRCIVSMRVLSVELTDYANCVNCSAMCGLVGPFGNHFSTIRWSMSRTKLIPALNALESNALGFMIGGIGLPCQRFCKPARRFQEGWVLNIEGLPPKS